MLSDTIPVFLNGRPVAMPPGSTLEQLVVHADPDLAAELLAGRAVATDARGIAVSAGETLLAGAIFRVTRSARSAGSALDA
jgi:hypothetical protein